MFFLIIVFLSILIICLYNDNLILSNWNSPIESKSQKLFSNNFHEMPLLIRKKFYIIYKFFNSLFFGIAIGSYVTQYEPLKIDDFPIMGIIFSLLAIPIALLYNKIMKIEYFYRFSLFVEIIMLIWISLYLADPWSESSSFQHSYQIALIIYIARQITFLFGDFLARAETIFVNETTILSKIDTIKQVGTIFGMIISVIIYNLLESKFGVSENEEKVYYIHFLLCLIQVIIIIVLHNAFVQKAK